MPKPKVVGEGIVEFPLGERGKRKVDKKPWTLSMGCHKGTLMSRDCSSEECDSLEQCRQQVAEAEESWARIGYYVWYATATGPNGEKVKLHQGTPYQ